MTHITLPLKNQEGSAIIMALMALAVLTIIGISSINTNIIESQIVRNEQVYQQNFYQAEAAAMEAAQTLEDETNIDNLRPDSGSEIPMLVATDIDLWTVNANDLQTLTTSMSGGESGAAASSVVVNNQAFFSATAEGVVSGSLDMTSDSNVYGFKIYGYSGDNNGNVFITIGYKKRM
jgi:Tfp pilus assembly protein PilX